jgi:hypothetical protein
MNKRSEGIKKKNLWLAGICNFEHGEGLWSLYVLPMRLTIFCLLAFMRTRRSVTTRLSPPRRARAAFRSLPSSDYLGAHAGMRALPGARFPNKIARLEYEDCAR